MAADLAAVGQALAEARRQPLDVVEGRPLSAFVCLYSVKMKLASQRGLILRSLESSQISTVTDSISRPDPTDLNFPIRSTAL